MQLGTMINAFRTTRENKTDAPYLTQLQRAAQLGFRVFDFGTTTSTRNPADELRQDSWEAAIDDLCEQNARIGGRFSQSHAPYNGNLFTYGKQPDEEYVKMFHEMCRRTVLATARLGGKWVVVHPITDSVNTEYDNEIQCRTNYEFYAPMVETARRAGVGIAFENMIENPTGAHRRSFGADTDDLMAIVDAFGDDSVGICWDFGHGRMLYGDTPRQLRRIGSRLVATHVADNKGDRDSHLAPFVGGNVKWETIMPTLREIDYKGDFIFEIHSFFANMPEALLPSAAKLAIEFGEYCIQMAK